MLMLPIALFCNDAGLATLLLDLHKTQALFADVLLHPPNPDVSAERVFDSLRPLNFAGALILDEGVQRGAQRSASRSSLDAREVGAADVLSVTAAGLIADYSLGQALGQALARAGWHARGASVVILGSGVRARAISRELASSGARQLAVLASSRPVAEESTRQLAATTQVIAGAQGDPLTLRLLEKADLLVRLEGTQEVPNELLGPHLTVVDLFERTMSSLRQQALELGALSLGLRDVQAEQLALTLGQLLETRLDARLFLELFHGL